MKVDKSNPNIVLAIPDYYLHQGLLEMSQGVEKSASNVVLKESKETFRKNEQEGDHPRGADGQFVEGHGTTAPKPKTTGRGGVREGAGRLPKDAHKAIPKVKSRIQEQHPDWDESQIKDELLKQAEERGKPDWEEYINEPDKYMERLDRQRKEAMESRYNRIKVGGKTISDIDSVSDMDAIRAGLKQSERSFQREIQTQKAIKSAWDKFRDNDLDEVERNNAKLILTAGVIASAIGMGSLLYLGRPKFLSFVPDKALSVYDLEGINRILKSRFAQYGRGKAKFIHEGLEPGAAGNLENIAREYGIQPDDPSRLKTLKNIVNDEKSYSKVPNPQLIKFMRVTDPMTKSSVPRGALENIPGLDIASNEVSWFNKRIATYIQRRRGKIGPNEVAAIKMGEVWTGFQGPVNKLNDYHWIDRKAGRSARRAYKKEMGDIDLRSGIAFTRKKNKNSSEVVLDGLSIFKIKELHRQFLKSEIKGIKDIKRISSKDIRTRMYDKDRLAAIGLTIENARGSRYPNIDIIDQKAFDRFWKSMQSVGEDVLLPRWIGKRKDAVSLAKATEKLNEEYGGWSNFLHSQVFGRIAGKILAGLSIGTGLSSATAYTFLSLADAPAKIIAQEQAKKQKSDIELAKLEKAETEAAHITDTQHKREVALKKQIKELEVEKADVRAQRQQDIDAELAKLRLQYEYEKEQPKGAESESAEDIKRQNAEVINKKEFLNIITKEPNDQVEGLPFSIQEVIDETADDMIKMFSGISDCIQIVVNNKMPGHELYEQLNEVLVNLYLTMKMRAQFDENGDISDEF